MSHSTDRTVVFMGFAEALSGPEVAWSLLDAGYEVHAFTREGCEPALRKSSSVTLHSIPAPEHSTSASLAGLTALLTRFPGAVLLPLDDHSLWLCQQLDVPSILMAGAMGSPASVALDKRLQVEAAIRAGFHVPTTTVLLPGDSLPQIEHYPVIIKPALAAREFGGQIMRGKFHGIAGAAEAEDLRSSLDFDEPMLMQPMIPGVGEGVFGIRTANGVRCWSGHRRVRMMNPSGSGSSACQRHEPSESIVAIVDRFLADIDWRGIFMVELLRGDDDKLWFMEINGRSWGSMALARQHGLEYPAWAVQLALDSGFEPTAKDVAENEIVCRHLGRELVHIAMVMRGQKSKAFHRWPTRLQTLWRVCRIGSRDRWYNWRSGDTAVFWSDCWQTLRAQVFKKKPRKRGFVRKVLDRLAIPGVRTRQREMQRCDGLASQIEDAKSVLFVCYGNINRSAVAEAHMRALGVPIEIESCGFHDKNGRPADPGMVAAARGMEIELGSSRSKTIDQAMVARADLILVMECWHLVRLHFLFPESRGKSALLGAVSQDSVLEIADPFGKSPEGYLLGLNEVTAVTSVLARRFGSPGNSGVHPGETSSD